MKVKLIFFLISESFLEELIDYHVIENAINYSDHLPIAIAMYLNDGNLATCLSEPYRASKVTHRSLRWDHGNKLLYYDLSRDFLFGVDSEIDDLTQFNIGGKFSPDLLNVEIDKIYDDIIFALNESARLSIPSLKIVCLKYWWGQEMNELKFKSVSSFRAWQAAGKPRTGLIHDEMRINRMNYRKSIREKEKHVALEISNDPHEALVQKILQLSGRPGKINLEIAKGK